MLRGLNAIRTYFRIHAKKPFWKPEYEYFPHHAWQKGKWVVIERPEEPVEDIVYDALDKPEAWEGPMVAYD